MAALPVILGTQVDRPVVATDGPFLGLDELAVTHGPGLRMAFHLEQEVHGAGNLGVGEVWHGGESVCVLAKTFAQQAQFMDTGRVGWGTVAHWRLIEVLTALVLRIYAVRDEVRLTTTNVIALCDILAKNL
ncbi:unnamed protein product [Miscanthus lutarioriparius]|uniref:Uncharacterized protein n=1 Tax=Miscanthus lutarioriparius TaxID=422564 RepID=A0A811N5Z1_9POAL|nr:unnamed protein product [Miscanthus lutarioriparius]